jgi:hypothetical protein
MKHKVRMLTSQKGVHDGELHPVHFEEGTEHEIGPDLLQGFISLGAVELVEDGQDDTEGTESTDAEGNGEKSLDGAPENKMRKPVKGKK